MAGVPAIGAGELWAAKFAASGAASPDPQLPQKRAFGSFDVPHVGQALASAVPHSMQKRRSDRFSVPQFGQLMMEP